MSSETLSGEQAGHGGTLEVRLLTFDEPCPYLAGRTATLEGFPAASADPGLYRELMDHGFRRSGMFFYRPHCGGCRQCQPLRVPVASFAPSRSQRRCWQRNQDLSVQKGELELTDEKHDLYCRYLAQKHSDDSERDISRLRDFLYNRVVDTVEFCYRDRAGRLLAVGICDVFDDAISSVYCFYDPLERRRSLGTFTALREIEYARQRGLGYYYLGFLVRDCPSMRYKASYRPNELLDVSRGWIVGEPGLPGVGSVPDKQGQTDGASLPSRAGG
jgi:leucyl-tRNA---protein transferase